MMNTDQVFLIVNTLALFSWIPLILSPFSTKVRNLLFTTTVTGLSLLYSAMFIRFFEVSEFSSFSTLSGLMELFTSKEAVLMGWIHYLAFDLLAGLYIAKDAAKNSINIWLLRPLFLFVFMAGPLGFIFYLIARTAATRTYKFE